MVRVELESRSPRQRKHYSVYATLLDGLQNYFDAEKNYNKYFSSENPKYTIDEWCDQQFTDLINKINRVPFVSEAADKGTAFNELVDALLKKPLPQRAQDGDFSYGKITFEVVNITIKGRRKDAPIVVSDAYKCTFYTEREPQEFTFLKSLVDEFVAYYGGAVSQVFCYGTLDTQFGDIDLYGYVDELMPFSVHDIKTTSRYSAGNFKNHWQHLVYPYCLNRMGIKINDFEYNITNFKDTFTEMYAFKEERDVPILRDHCEKFIQFIETHKNIITDEKVFRPLQRWTEE